MVFFRCSVGYQVRSAVCDGVGIFSVLIICCGRIVLSTEFTTLGLIVASAHRHEDGVAQHGHEVAAWLFQCVLYGIVINSFYTNLVEIGNFTADVLGYVF